MCVYIYGSCVYVYLENGIYSVCKFVCVYVCVFM